MLKHIPFYASLLDRVLYGKKVSTVSHVLVYGAIETHSMGDKGCIASNDRIALETGLKETTVSRIISELNKANWVRVVLGPRQGVQQPRIGITPLLNITVPTKSELAAQKMNIQDDSWKSTEQSQLLRSSSDASRLSGSSQVDYPGVKIDTGSIDTKKDIDKSISKNVKWDAEDIRLTELLFELMYSNKPELGKKRATANDYNTIRKMRETDKRDATVIEGLIRWSQASDFWWKNIRSTATLRRQYETLYLQAFSDYKIKQKNKVMKV